MRRHIRKAIGQCYSRVFPVDREDQVLNFYALLRRSGRGYIPGLEEFRDLCDSFAGRAFIVLTFYGRDLVAGVLVLCTKGVASYMYPAVSFQGRRLLCGYLAVWESLQEARRRGCTAFDFEGLYDERFPSLRRWKGFTAFKERFGGQEISYPGPFVKYVFPFSG